MQCCSKMHFRLYEIQVCVVIGLKKWLLSIAICTVHVGLVICLMHKRAKSSFYALHVFRILKVFCFPNLTMYSWFPSLFEIFASFKEEKILSSFLHHKNAPNGKKFNLYIIMVYCYPTCIYNGPVHLHRECVALNHIFGFLGLNKSTFIFGQTQFSTP